MHRRIGNVHAPFDPLVTKLIEKGAHVKNSDSKPLPLTNSAYLNPFNGNFEDPEEYFSDEGQFNIKGRLQILFPVLDRSPEDGSISLKELEGWNLQQATDQLIYRTRKEMNEHDKDNDGAITFAEYLPRFSDEDIGWWKDKFVNADIDDNGYLNFTEFMEGMDHDQDGKLNFNEFRAQAYDNYKNTLEFESGGDDVPSAEEKFDELDLNKDRLLTEEELRPIIHYLHPGELTYATHYTRFLIHEADDDKDGELTLNEMMDHHHIFYNTVIMDYDIGDDDDFHDEF
ncbi:hypothetical protein IFM89_029681 [Coptis chinensis]|uniref:EF-hand domain-containing protein n=1 Tax=Coptis chinensis TaxID=261450 RepID=A0A835IH63_9MAGN|nr:hypothetical protein IFM89_029681 [Coptis chinensis]